jgi:hypothetical protein
MCEKGLTRYKERKNKCVVYSPTDVLTEPQLFEAVGMLVIFIHTLIAHRGVGLFYGHVYVWA